MLFPAFKRVFGRIRYVVLASIIAFGVFVLSVWLQNLKLVLIIITSSIATILEKFNILAGLLGSIQTNFSVFSAFYTIAIAVLFGINIAMIVFYIRQLRVFPRQGGAAMSLSGFISGMFGIGCAACGTLVLGPLLSLIGAGGLIAFLPFGGQEFGVLGLSILGFSIFLVAKKIQDPLVCNIQNRKSDFR